MNELRSAIITTAWLLVLIKGHVASFHSLICCVGDCTLRLRPKIRSTRVC